MLLHTIGPGVEDLLRAKYLFVDHKGALRAYLSIPWHLYPCIPPDHAFTACQRLILAALAADDAALDIELETGRPRRTTALDRLKRLEGLATHTRSQTANVRPVPIVDGAVPGEDVEDVDMLEELARDSNERVDADSHAQPAPDVEACTPVPAMDEDARPNVDDMGSVAGRQKKQPGPSDYDVYRHDIHLDLWTPHALQLMIRKDKKLWFKLLL
ncbi:hypothetical protein EXIGLDRAFT_782526 [Exidia glandulosa HHB12029]|uniref:Uncharacterized protein n=1 Tax=Exidia glandulosa HHB12029 TaxID=1314781 RepID=A0A166NLN3_EXIGL|nr:hypothetical protein EXIGLDRAFT_782526 [Exidia glandulosa HHB12029]